MKVKLKPGEVLKTITIGNDKVVFRFPKESDAQGALEHINELVKEKAYIGMQTIQNIDDEKKFLKDALENIKKQNKMTVVVEVNGKYRGTADVSRKPLDANKHVCSIGIGLHSEVRSLGIGTQLMELLEMLGKDILKCEIMEISVYEPNNAAKGLYEKLGFRETGKIPRGVHYYGKYYDELIMVKKL